MLCLGGLRGNERQSVNDDVSPWLAVRNSKSPPRKGENAVTRNTMRCTGVVMFCLAITAGSERAPLRADPPSRSLRLPVASNEEAWKQLPRQSPALPIWARMLTGPVPQTTGAMLDLDLIHRAKNPL